jgi:hypothetical protein
MKIWLILFEFSNLPVEYERQKTLGCLDIYTAIIDILVSILVHINYVCSNVDGCLSLLGIEVNVIGVEVYGNWVHGSARHIHSSRDAAVG